MSVWPGLRSGVCVQHICTRRSYFWRILFGIFPTSHSVPLCVTFLFLSPRVLGAAFPLMSWSSSIISTTACDIREEKPIACVSSPSLLVCSRIQVENPPSSPSAHRSVVKFLIRTFSFSHLFSFYPLFFSFSMRGSPSSLSRCVCAPSTILLAFSLDIRSSPGYRNACTARLWMLHAFVCLPDREQTVVVLFCRLNAPLIGKLEVSVSRSSNWPIWSRRIFWIMGRLIADLETPLLPVRTTEAQIRAKFKDMKEMNQTANSSYRRLNYVPRPRRGNICFVGNHGEILVSLVGSNAVFGTIQNFFTSKYSGWSGRSLTQFKARCPWQLHRLQTSAGLQNSFDTAWPFVSKSEQHSRKMKVGSKLSQSERTLKVNRRHI